MVSLNEKNETVHAVVCPQCRYVGIADAFNEDGPLKVGHLKCRRCTLEWSTVPPTVNSPSIVGGAS
jgi:hypothetical protein